MKQTLLIIMLLCFCSCGSKQRAGSGGVSAHIDIAMVEESAVMLRLDTWMSDNGYEKKKEAWGQIAGEEKPRNNKGEIVRPIAYVKKLPGNQGHYAWGIAAPTKSHRYVTVFHDAAYYASSDRALKTFENHFDQESFRLRMYIDKSFETYME